ncbi:solute carrier family 66 member 3 isoform X2 [Corythoichthys intestinalis]|uniref:solute carrier family 66 member 3 isoform X2 n=1 Tax=Corythoichthys intestinalis TaxID=161448 RepID=UPI0025A4D4F4|nr:solute carrier family 66 member 3 isoform X2 [Corythoichthys intestinalis]
MFSECVRKPGENVAHRKARTGFKTQTSVGYIVFVTYQVYYDYPPPTYLEYPILIAQDVVLLLLILLYDGRLQNSLVYSVVFVVGWRLLTVEKWIIDFAMSLCTFISAASKFAQLQCLWKSKDAGQVSALTWGLATYTCATRIYTTMATTGDMQVLVRFIVMTFLNLWVLLSVLYYRRQGRSSIKED